MQRLTNPLQTKLLRLLLAETVEIPPIFYRAMYFKAFFHIYVRRSLTHLLLPLPRVFRRVQEAGRLQK